LARLIRPIVESGGVPREGRGFSVEELAEAGLTPGRARAMGIPVDTRRKTSHPENVEALKAFLEEVGDAELKVPKPKKAHKHLPGRVFRGKTSAGRKMRALVR